MRCNLVKIPPQERADLCGQYPKYKQCRYCRNTHILHCDYPVKKVRDIWLKCNTPMCENCIQKVSIDSETCFCEDHFYPAKEAYQRKMEKAQSLLFSDPDKHLSKMEKRGKALWAMQNVLATEQGWTVSVPTLRYVKRNYVTFNLDPFYYFCSCDESSYEDDVESEEDCEHIYAVKYYRGELK